MRKYLLLILVLSVFSAGQAYAGISFVKKITLVTEDKEDLLLQQKFYSEGDMLRIEEEAKGIEGNPGTRLYDLKNKKLYTIMLDIKLYMEQDIELEKDNIMFEIPPEKKYARHKDIKVLRTKQGEEEIQGHPAVRYEVKVARTKEKGKEEQVLDKYILWTATDLGEMPIKYEFDLQNNSKKVIEYIDIKTDAIDPSLFVLPEGYMPINPF